MAVPRIDKIVDQDIALLLQAVHRAVKALPSALAVVSDGFVELLFIVLIESSTHLLQKVRFGCVFLAFCLSRCFDGIEA